MMFFGGWMFIGWVIIIGLIIWGVVAFSHRNEPNYRSHGPGQDPLEIARQRYARGEITKEQFDQIKKDLSG